MELFLESYLANPRQRRIGEVRQVGPVSCVHYDYYWEGRHIQADNFFLSPEGDLMAAMQAIIAYQPADEHQIFVPQTDPAVSDIMAGFGCSKTETHVLMERPLTELDGYIETAVPVHHVSTPEDVTTFNNVLQGNLALRTDALEGPFRFYYVLDGQTPAAQGRSWRCRPDVTWESHIYTDPAFQRRGYGTAVMQRILRDAALDGVTTSVLLATDAGRRIYLKLDYVDRLAIGCYKWQKA